MTLLQDGGVILDNDSLSALRERGAIVQAVPQAPLLNDWHAGLIDLAHEGGAFPFRAVNTDDARDWRYYGMWIPNDAGHAHVCSVHPDDRGVLAWEIGMALANDDTSAFFARLIREPCHVRW